MGVHTGKGFQNLRVLVSMLVVSGALWEEPLTLNPRPKKSLLHPQGGTPFFFLHSPYFRGVP